jgi:hypothetical protein
MAMVKGMDWGRYSPISPEGRVDSINTNVCRTQADLVKPEGVAV